MLAFANSGEAAVLNVLISCSPEDRATAGRIAAKLRVHGIKVRPEGHSTGDWPHPTDEDIQQSDMVIVLVSPAAVSSHETYSIWTAAMGSNRRVLLLLIDDAERGDLAPALHQAEAIPLGADEEHGVEVLVASIRAAARIGDQRPTAAITADTVGRESPRTADPGKPSSRDVFVVISFDDAMDPTFDAIRLAARKVGLTAQRIKDDEGDYVISEQILKKINEALFIVADLTQERPNVYFELGYARGKGKTVITLIKKGSEPHFDVQGWTCLQYTDSRPLEKLLIKRFKRELKLLGCGDEQ